MKLAIESQIAAFQDWHVAAAILWTGVVTTALTSYGENIAMKKLSAAESTVIYSTEPLWGALFATYALGESLGWNTFLGAALILTACVWSSVGPSLTLAGLFSSSASLEASIGSMDEIAANINANWLELTELFSKE
jgi:drug/metabolite transporter (DMT)-like permease